MSATVACWRGATSTSCSRVVSGFSPSPARPPPARSTTRSPATARADRGGQLGPGRVLEQEPGRAARDRAAKIAGPPERGEDQHAAAGQRAASWPAVSRPFDPASRCRAGRRRARRERGSPHPSPRSTWATTSRSGSSEEPGKRAADHRLVLREEDADHAPAPGRSPPAGTRRRVDARLEPPAAARARSSSPASPLPPGRHGGVPAPSSTISTAAWSSPAGTR